MQFIVTGYDGTDDGALQRRLAARENHLQLAKEMFDSGKFLYAAAILSEEGKMMGSMIICDFPDKEQLDIWLKQEPYMIGDVWKNVDVKRAQVAAFCLDK